MNSQDVPVLASEAARIIGVSVDTIRRWERRGQLVAQRTAEGIRLFDRADIERLATQRQANRGA